MPPPVSDSEPDALRQPTTSLSSLLLEFATTFSADRMRVGDIIDSLGNRSFGFILLIFSIPTSLPVVAIPGVSTLTGLPMLLITLQMMLGYDRVYLPRWIANSSIATSSFQRLITKVTPWLQRIERLMRPRIILLTKGHAERWLGAFCVPLAFVLVLPIPLGNFLPGLAILFIALGLIERDGICVLAGLALGIASWIFLSGIVWIVFTRLLPGIAQFFNI